jgi:rod shape determining protein RodA
MKNSKNYIQIDLILILVSFILISLISIYNAQQFEQYGGENFVIKQVIWFGIGIIFLILLQFIDIDTIYRFSFLIYILGLLVLFILNISPQSIAPEINNTKSWFKLSGITIQPSEFAKITTILFLASIITKHKKKYLVNTTKNDSILLMKLLISGVAPVILILQQPDFGTSMVFLFILALLIFLSGINWKVIFTLIAISLFIIISFFLLAIYYPSILTDIMDIQPYQIERITTWVNSNGSDPDSEYHIRQSLLAVGSGQLHGKGLKALEVYLPEAHTDFIFSVIGESFGFIGSAIVILIYFLFLFKLVILGLNMLYINIFGAYICFGFLGLVFIHTFQNIGMTIGIMPITGIPLLLISYGGSSIMSSMLGFSLIYIVQREYIKHKEYIFG